MGVGGWGVDWCEVSGCVGSGSEPTHTRPLHLALTVIRHRTNQCIFTQPHPPTMHVDNIESDSDRGARKPPSINSDMEIEMEIILTSWAGL